MKNRILRFLAGLLVGALVSAAAPASSPAEKVVCTDEPRARWLPEAKIREIFGDRNFALSKLKISRGNCYEFYAVSRDGSIVEAYYHPISGQLVRHNRVTATTSESQAAPPVTAR